MIYSFYNSEWINNLGKIVLYIEEHLLTTWKF